MSRRWVTVGQSFFAGLLILLGAAAPLAADRVEELPAWILFLLGGLVFAIGLSTLWAVIKKYLFAAAVTPAVGFAVVFLLVAILVYPAFNPVKSGRAFAAIIAEETVDSRAQGHRVMAFDLGNLPVHYAFYTNGIYTIETKDSADLARHLDQDAQVWAVANAKRLDELPPEIRDRLEIVATTRASRRDVALIVNRSNVER
jgi:hypothetical protein